MNKARKEFLCSRLGFSDASGGRKWYHGGKITRGESKMRIPALELQARVAQLQDRLRGEGIDGALLVQRADTLYYSGTAQNVHMYIPRDGRPVVLAYRDVERAQTESSWGVLPLTGISKLPLLIQGAQLPLPRVIGLEFDVLPVAQFERYRKAFPEARYVDVSGLIRRQRAVKSAWEIERLQEAAQIHAQVFEYAKEVIRPGMSEAELEGLLEGKARALGHSGYVRTRAFGSEFHFGSVTAGARAAVPSYFDGPVVGQGISIENPIGASLAPIAAGEPLVFDMVMCWRGYQIDQTRTLAIGHLDRELREAYELACAIAEKVRLALVPGRIAGDIYQEIIDWVRQETAYAENFMGYGPGRVSFIGHGVGLELDELPTLSRGSQEVLLPGMVVAVEPKFVFPGVGVAGIEDTLVVEGASGARYLSVAPRELAIL